MYYNTVTPFLKESLKVLMKNEYFDSFRLVGGTALSLQLGHRMSICQLILTYLLILITELLIST